MEEEACDRGSWFNDFTSIELKITTRIFEYIVIKLSYALYIPEYTTVEPNCTAPILEYTAIKLLRVFGRTIGLKEIDGNILVNILNYL